MLGRMIGAKYEENVYEVVDGDLIEEVKKANYVIANLESPVVNNPDKNADHLQFQGNPDVLNELKWVDAFSLSNNHINDCGEQGMNETISILAEKDFKYNGLFKGDYQPLLIEKGKVAVVTVTDMMNVPFADNNSWDILRVGEPRVMDIIREWKDKGWMVIVYAHIGMLLSRYPNPISVEYLHKCVDAGAGAIVSVHAHCLGCKEEYKGVPIFHSLGDFIMDGNSFRRRKSGMLRLMIENGKVAGYEIIPAVVNKENVTVRPTKRQSKRMLADFYSVSGNLARHSDNYPPFFKWQYKKEMMQHTASTLLYLVHTKGFGGMVKMVFKRGEEVGRMFKWVAKDRSKDQRDDDAIRADRKKFTDQELFK